MPLQLPSGTLKAYLPELQPSKCPDHSLCHKQSTKATVCLIKKTGFTREYIPTAFHIHFNEMHLISVVKRESDGISNGSIIMVCFSFWQKISSRSSRWSKLGWAELIRGNQRREYTFNNIDATASETSFISIHPGYGPCRSLYLFEGKQFSSQLYSNG